MLGSTTTRPPVKIATPAAAAPRAGHTLFVTVRDGLISARRDPVLPWLLLLVAGMNLAFAGPVTAGFPLLAAHSNWGAVGAGMLIGGFGLGAAVSGLGLVFVPRIPKAGLVALAGVCTMGVALIAVAAADTLAVAVTAAVILGIASGVFATVVHAIVLTRTPKTELGRVMALLSLSVEGVVPDQPCRLRTPHRNTRRERHHHDRRHARHRHHRRRRHPARATDPPTHRHSTAEPPSCGRGSSVEGEPNRHIPTPPPELSGICGCPHRRACRRVLGCRPDERRCCGSVGWRRLRVGRYRLPDGRLTFVTHGENTTFRHDSAAGRHLVRVHRPQRHGRDVDSTAAIRSELAWLEAIRADTELAVPEPLSARDGASTVEVSAAGETRVCSVLRWMDGRIREASARPVHLSRLGDAMARLHHQADAWRPPPEFVRIRWDHEAFFGDVMVYGDSSAAACWALLPTEVRTRFEAVAARMAEIMGLAAMSD